MRYRVLIKLWGPNASDRDRETPEFYRAVFVARHSSIKIISIVPSLVGCDRSANLLILVVVG
jgi:hypothetical protein